MSVYCGSRCESDHSLALANVIVKYKKVNKKSKEENRDGYEDTKTDIHLI